MTLVVPLRRLYWAELTALPRGRFVLPGTALLMAALTALAVVVAPSPLGLWSFALLVYGGGPVLLGALSAYQIASLRSSRFVQPLFTAPVTAGRVLVAHLLVGLTVAMAYVLATLPFLIVASLHIPMPESVVRLVVGGFLLSACAVFIGTSIGVLMAGRSVVVPVIFTTVFLFLSMLALVPSAMLQLDRVSDATFIMRILHVSPYVLASDGLDLLADDVGVRAKLPLLALGLLAAQVVLLFLIAHHAYVRAQGPEGWEAPRRSRLLIGAMAILVLIALPAAALEPAYVEVPDHEPNGRGWSSDRMNATVALVPSGARIHSATFDGYMAGTDKTPLLVGQVNERDLVIRLIVPEGTRSTSFHVTLSGDDRLRVEPRAITMTVVERDTAGSVLLRAPIRLQPLDPLDLTMNYHQLKVQLMQDEGTPGKPIASALVALRADIPHAAARMGAAGAPLLFLATTAALVRRIRTQ